MSPPPRTSAGWGRVMQRATTPPPWGGHLDKLHLLTPIRIITTILLAILCTVIIKRFISKTLRRVFQHAVPADRPRAEARYRALSSALRGALIGAIWTVAVITIVSELGVNIGAFVATATVVGGAIAFGAQNLIRDVIAGFFVLADDQFGIGDDVDVGLAAGVVERVTLRTVRLRDGEGGIWHVQHGNILRVANLSKTSVALLDLEVARAMDLDDLMRVAHELAGLLAADPQTAPLLVGQPVVVGITDVRDDRIVIRLSVATQPGRHHEIKRAWRVLILGAFARGDLLAPPAPAALGGA